MSQPWYRFILKLGTYASLASLFFLNKHFYFPYITSKQLYFNILIEVLAVIWVAYLWKYPADRPKKSWITRGWLAYLAVVLLTCFTGIDFNLSFWGDLERMLGWFPLFHFFLLYLIAITAFRNWRDWQPLLITMSGAGVLLSLIGIFQNYNASMLGNAAYMGTVTLMAIFITLLLIGRSRNWLLALPYWFALAILAIGFVRADISGAYAGLAAGLLSYGIVMSLLNRSKKIRRIGWIGVATFVVAVGLVFSLRWSETLNNSQLGKVFRDFSLSNPTLNTRFLSWQYALKDFPEHWLLGVGYGNYSLTFDRQFTGKFYDFGKGEDYFDRAHNNIVEIATTTGSLGLLTYLFMFAWVMIYLIRAYCHKRLDLPEFAALFALMVAYFVQNLALFDCLASYLYLMLMLAFINNAYRQPEATKCNNPGWNKKETIVLIVGGATVAWVIWFANTSTIKMLNKTIDGIIAINQGQVYSALTIFKEAEAANSPLIRDGRSAMANAYIGGSYYLEQLSGSQLAEIISYVDQQNAKNIKYNPKDSHLNMQRAQFLSLASQTSKNNLSAGYAKDGLMAAEKAIENGYNHVLPHYVKAQILSDLDQPDEAIAELKATLKISEKYWDTFCHLSRMQLNRGVDKDEAYRNLERCLDEGGVTLLGPGNYLNEALKYYQEKNDNVRLTMLTEQLVRLYPQGAEIWLRLSQLYSRQGRNEEAQYAAEQAAQLKPELKEQSKNINGN